MSDSPEKIYITGRAKSKVCGIGFYNAYDKRDVVYSEEYIRADLVQAQLAQARELLEIVAAVNDEITAKCRRHIDDNQQLRDRLAGEFAAGQKHMLDRCIKRVLEIYTPASKNNRKTAAIAKVLELIRAMSITPTQPAQEGQ